MGVFRNKLSEYLPAYVPRLFPLSRRNEYQADGTAALWVGVSQYKQALYPVVSVERPAETAAEISGETGHHPTLQERLERVGSLE